MTHIQWDVYPLVATSEQPHKWLQIQAHLQLAPKTIDAYGRCLNDYLAFCQKLGILPESAQREQIALYVQDLANRPHPKGDGSLSFSPGRGLANATMQQRITVVRLFYDHLIEQQLRSNNPVGRGQYVRGKGYGGKRDRGILPHYQKMPWIPSDEEWQRFLLAFKDELLRNQVMLLLAYDGALRREELVRVEINDFDFALRHLRIRAEHTKSKRERIVGYGETTSQFLEAYLRHRRDLSPQSGPLFLSESRRNPAQPLSVVLWSKVVQRIARQCHLPRFTTHTTRHLRLTHMARAKMDLHQIALYAGHASIQTTMIYIHLSGAELTEAVAKSLASFDHWMQTLFGGKS